MTFEKAVSQCHVRSSIYRKDAPHKRYAKNHEIPLENRVPLDDQLADDWEEYDPNDDYNISLGAEGG